MRFPEGLSLADSLWMSAASSAVLSWMLKRQWAHWQNRKKKDVRDIIRGQSIDFRTAYRNCFNAFGEDNIRRGYVAAIWRRRLGWSRTFPAVRASKFTKCEKKKKGSHFFGREAALWSRWEAWLSKRAQLRKVSARTKMTTDLSFFCDLRGGMVVYKDVTGSWDEKRTKVCVEDSKTQNSVYIQMAWEKKERRAGKIHHRRTPSSQLKVTETMW